MYFYCGQRAPIWWLARFATLQKFTHQRFYGWLIHHRWFIGIVTYEVGAREEHEP